jgi:hypothetical protein
MNVSQSVVIAYDMDSLVIQKAGVGGTTVIGMIRYTYFIAQGLDMKAADH